MFSFIVLFLVSGFFCFPTVKVLRILEALLMWAVKIGKNWDKKVEHKCFDPRKSSFIEEDGNTTLRMSSTCMQQSQWRCSIWVSIYHEVLFRLIMIYLLTSCQHPATKDLFLRNTKQLVNTSFKQSRVLEKERLKVEVTISYFIISSNYQISFN